MVTATAPRTVLSATGGEPAVTSIDLAPVAAQTATRTISIIARTAPRPSPSLRPGER